MKRKPRRESVWTATDSLLLDVEQVERWASVAIADKDSPTSALVSVVTRLRSVADSLADYLFRSSKPARKRERGCAPGAPRRTPPRIGEKQREGQLKPANSEGRSPERSEA